jgi:predicted methyltransferase
VPSCTSPPTSDRSERRGLRLHHDVAPVSAGAVLVYARPMRTAKILATALAVALPLGWGCNVNYSSSSNPPDDANNSVKGTPIETAEPAEKPLPAEKPDPQAEAKKKYDEAIAELEAEYKAEAARWTPELKAAVTKLTATKWRATNAALKAALASEHRRPNHASRDAFRHPQETMAFFGLRPTMNVFEVGPGAGWWTELLAVVLASKGTLAIATFDTKSDDLTTAYYARATELMLETAPELYGKVERVQNSKPGAYELGPAESRDMILCMRMAHNLVRSNGLENFLAQAHAALKTGGVLAIEQHRAPEGSDPAKTAPQGYVPEAWLIEQVEKAGFKLEKKSEINANPKDTKDYPKGVWTLPPNFAEGDKDKAKYEAIGESDRMTLKFVKPKTKTPAGGLKAKPADAKVDPKKVDATKIDAAKSDEKKLEVEKPVEKTK